MFEVVPCLRITASCGRQALALLLIIAALAEDPRSRRRPQTHDVCEAFRARSNSAALPKVCQPWRDKDHLSFLQTKVSLSLTASRGEQLATVGNASAAEVLLAGPSGSEGGATLGGVPGAASALAAPVVLPERRAPATALAPSPAASPTQWAAVATALMLAVAGGCLAHIASLGPGPDSDPRVLAAASALSAAVASLALAVDGAVATVVVSMLPKYSHGGTSILLFCTKPVVGAVGSLALALLLQEGVRRSRVIIGAGLAALSAACLGLAVVESLAAALALCALAAAASSAVFAAALHAALVEAPLGRAGWRMASAFAGLIAGSVIGPWVGGLLYQLHGPAGTLALLAAAVAATCLVHCVACLCRSHAEGQGSSASSVDNGCPDSDGICGVAAAHSLHGGKGQPVVAEQALANVTAQLFRDPKRRVLLVGFALSGAVLALHGTIVPFQLQRDRVFSEIGYLGLAESAASLVLLAAVLIAGLAADATREQVAVRAMALATVVNMLGLRALSEVKGPGNARLATLGMVASHAGLGGTIGFALPLVAALSRQQDGPVSSPAAAAVAAAVGATLSIGDALGTLMQLSLFPRLGCGRTVAIFAVLLLFHVFAVLLVPGWMRGNHACKAKAIPSKMPIPTSRYRLLLSRIQTYRRSWSARG